MLADGIVDSLSGFMLDELCSDILLLSYWFIVFGSNSTESDEMLCINSCWMDGHPRFCYCVVGIFELLHLLGHRQGQLPTSYWLLPCLAPGIVRTYISVAA